MIKQIALVMTITLSGCGIQRADLKAEQEKIVQSWRDWPAKAKAGNPAFYFSDDAIITGDKIPLSRGKSEIIKFYANMPKISGMIIKWNETPNIMQISKNGDMAYSLDTLKVSLPDSTGKIQTQISQGIHLWNKDAAGNWKVSLLAIYSHK